MDEYTIHYSVVGRVNPAKPNLPPKYYPKARRNGKTKQSEMNKIVAKVCQLSEGDVSNAIITTRNVTIDRMCLGDSVELEGLGTFYLALKGKPTDSPEQFTWRNIEDVVVKFKVCPSLKKRLGTAHFKRISQHERNRPISDWKWYKK